MHTKQLQDARSPASEVWCSVEPPGRPAGGAKALAGRHAMDCD